MNINFDIDSNLALYICIAIGVILVIIIICSIIKKRRNKDDSPMSILNVDFNGVASLDDKTFNYGYEKENTVVMKTIEEEKEEENKENEKK